MIVAIDSGNSSTKIGLFDKGKIIKIIHKKSFQSMVQAVHQLKPKSIIISTVKFSKEKITNAFKDYRYNILDETTVLPFNISYKSIETLGSDRIAAVAGAIEQHKDENILIIQTGTCITYDFINTSGNYLGGGISPGIEMRFKALNKLTKNLPLGDFIEEIQLIGQTTLESIQSGVINGCVAEIQGLIDRYSSEYSNLKIILTGGFVKFFEYKLKGSIFAIPNLVLWGLYNIYQFDEDKKKG